MPSKKNAVASETSEYGTTFMDEVKYNMPEGFISLPYINLLIEKIAARLNIDEGQVEISVSRGDHKIEVHPESLLSVFSETAKNNHTIDTIYLEGGIQQFNQDSHGSITVTVYLKNTPPANTLSNHTSTTIEVTAEIYGVARSKKTSQAIVDWGRGTKRDLLTMEAFKQEQNDGTLVIDGLTGKVIKQKDVTDNLPAPVFVVNPVKIDSIKDNGFKEFKQPKIYILVIFAIATIIISLFAWLIK